MTPGIIPFLLLFIPILEIVVFILVGGQIGVVATLAMILFTAILGSILLRVQGFSIINRIREQTERGELPGRELGNGAMILAAGILLLTPGFVTDSIGFLLFIPPVREIIWSVVASKVIVRGPGGFHGEKQPGNMDDGIVDLDPDEFSEKPNPDSPWISDDGKSNKP